MNTAENVFVGIPGQSLDRSSASLLAEHRPAGVVLFQRNIASVEQFLALIAELRQLLPDAILAVDAEGGRVDRLKDLVGEAPAASLLARRPPASALAAGRLVAQSLRLFDLDIDFAPVVDLDRGERGNGLDGRYLGSRSARITPRARSFLRGLHSGGVGGCLKHFPGLGAATADSHHEPAVIELTAEELQADLKPYWSLTALAGAVMVGHAIYPAFDRQSRPASLSPAVIGDLLREQLGFDGLVLSDDLEMNALERYGQLADRAEAAFAAGCDAVLACASLEALPELAERLGKRKFDRRRRDSRRRLEIYRQRLRTLRWANDALTLDHDANRLAAVREGLLAVREGLAAFQAI